MPIELKNGTVCSRHHYSLNLETLLFKETNKSKKNGTTSAVKVEKLQRPEKLSNIGTVKVEKIYKDERQASTIKETITATC